jgi:nucleoid-associated protein YgaU
VLDVPGNRETLFQIAARDSIYGDPKKWILLYRSNQAKIDSRYQRYLKENPTKKYSRPEDLILPGQVLDVPR